jgi:hypothetical protein
MASLIDPQCGIPTFNMSSVIVAEQCGKYNGYIFSIVVSIIILIVSIFMYESSNLEKDINKPKKRNNVILIIGGVLIMLSWTAPFILGFIGKRKWQSYDLQVQELVKTGVSQQDAIKQVQAIWTSKLQANAIRGAGSDIAISLLARR